MSQKKQKRIIELPKKKIKKTRTTTMMMMKRCKFRNRPHQVKKSRYLPPHLAHLLHQIHFDRIFFRPSVCYIIKPQIIMLTMTMTTMRRIIQAQHTHMVLKDGTSLVIQLLQKTTIQIIRKINLLLLRISRSLEEPPSVHHLHHHPPQLHPLHPHRPDQLRLKKEKIKVRMKD